jgi:hypothetical protein
LVDEDADEEERQRMKLGGDEDGCREEHMQTYEDEDELLSWLALQDLYERNCPMCKKA